MKKKELEDLRRLRKAIVAEERKLQKDKARRDRLERDATKFIGKIDDEYLAQIVWKRYIDGKRWADIALDIGGGNTEESVRKMSERFFKKG